MSNSQGVHVRDLFSLEGRVALLTGSTDGLGFFSAQALAEAGATVIVTSRDAGRAEKAAERLGGAGNGVARGVALDLTDEENVREVINGIAEREGRLDILVNNASGRGTTRDNDYAYDAPERQPLEEFEYTLRHNLTSTFLCIKHVLPIMKRARSGSIINLSSISAVIGRDRSVYDADPTMVPNTADYSAAKAGVLGLTLDLAAQVGKDGIRINALLPGSFRRETHPPGFVERFAAHTMLGRLGEFGSDLKGAVLFLAADASRYMTGQQLVVDGGFLTFR